MKTSIPRERLFDPTLRAFVAKREYIEAMRYYRGQYQTGRDEATESIDFVREQLEKERDGGAAPATLVAWSHPVTAPQSDEKKIAYAASLKAQSSEEDEAEMVEAKQEELSEEYDDPDENLNSSPYELPGSFGRPELERAYQREKARSEESESRGDPESEDVLDQENEPREEDEGTDDEGLEDDDDELFEEDEDLDEDTPEPARNEAPTLAPQVLPPTHQEPAEETPRAEWPASSVRVLRGPAMDEPPAGLPSWEGLSPSMRRELLSLDLQDAIRFYWGEVGCSLSEAKAYVSYWFFKHR